VKKFAALSDGKICCNHEENADINAAKNVLAVGHAF
jgi:transposase